MKILPELRVRIKKPNFFWLTFLILLIQFDKAKINISKWEYHGVYYVKNKVFPVMVYVP